MWWYKSSCRDVKVLCFNHPFGVLPSAPHVACSCKLYYITVQFDIIFSITVKGKNNQIVDYLQIQCSKIYSYAGFVKRNKNIF